MQQKPGSIDKMPLPHLPTEVGEIVLDNAIAMLSRNCRRAGTVEHAVIYGEAMKALAGVSRFDAREVAGSVGQFPVSSQQALTSNC